MFRNMMLFTSVIAFALPMALSQPATARPLTTPAQPAEWCWGDCEDDGGSDGHGGGGNVDIDIKLKLCVAALVKSRSEFSSCEVLTGRECLARCTPEAVASSCALDLAAGVSPRSLASCQDEQMDACREQCYSGGAGFCERRGGYDEDYDHDHGGYGDEDCPDKDYEPYPSPDDGYDPRPYPGDDYDPRPYPGDDYDPHRPYPGDGYDPRPYPGDDYDPRPYPGDDYDPHRPYPGDDYDPEPSVPSWIFVGVDICMDLLIKVDIDG